ncbi:plasmid maintenance protein [Borrelia sp. RT1S]|uniref:plasmid maintenance protein n=1 Tax=Borrelia sp. RT1S TaxID=2898580 RepID=UPI001E601711|nr:plasmid maintenance protein [Borrelia sp. RT1S]UGQ17776.1 plasmid maintenance protein [Borrelia sp. RT1S]
MRQEKISRDPFNKVVDRRLKVFWVIQRLRCNYFQNNRRYSLGNVVSMVNSILERKGFKRVTKRTIQNDIKSFERLGLLKTNFNPLGKNNGSFTHYIINETLEKIASKVISKAYFSERKSRKDLEISKAVKKEQLREKTQKFKNSHQSFSHLLSKIQVKNNINKNSGIKTMKDKGKALEKSILYKFKDFMREDLVELREIVQTDVSYKNTLWNLKDYMEELIEYKERDALTFFKNKLKEKKNKVWFMSKKHTKTDFNLIIGEFKDRNKTKKQEMYSTCIKRVTPIMNYIDSPNDIKRVAELMPSMNIRSL